MNILVTLDRNYILPLRVMLGSLFLNNPKEQFEIYMISDDFTQTDIKEISDFCLKYNAYFHALSVPEGSFSEAPVIRYYTKAMYYRLLASEILPAELKRICYLDPDILIINSLRPLYDIDMSDKLFAAAKHSGLTGVSDYVNKIRLAAYDAEGYYNSGVLLMNLSRMREVITSAEIFSYAKKHKDALILPDQDILNGLYGAQILSLDDGIWNYDARKFEKYFLTSQGERDMDFIMDHTAILHFCGKSKPWTKNYIGYFASLYKHYQRLIERIK